MKSTLTKLNVLEVNKFNIVENWMLHYYWEGKDIKKSINKSLEHYREMEGIIVDITTEETKEFLKEYINKCIDDIDYLTNELNEERKKWASPSFRNLKEYFAHYETPIKTATDYQNFLKDYVITEF